MVVGDEDPYCLVIFRGPRPAQRKFRLAQCMSWAAEIKVAASTFNSGISHRGIPPVMVASGVRMSWITGRAGDRLATLLQPPTHQDASRCAAEHVVVQQLTQEVDALGRGSGSL